jgi:hypothetical protein
MNWVGSWGASSPCQPVTASAATHPVLEDRLEPLFRDVPEAILAEESVAVAIAPCFSA